jgi:phospholipid transport system substrate-binding protein
VRFSRHVLLGFVTGAVLLGGAAAPARAGAPTERLRGFFGAVETLLADPAVEPLDKVARVKHLVTDLSDAGGASAAALGPEWHTRSAAEQREFAGLFAELLERGFVARLAGTVSASSGVTLRWLGETLTGDQATVRTLVRARDGRDVIVEYRMTLRRGRWLVNDVVLDGVSTVANYRAQFRRLLGQGSYRDVLTMLRDKLDAETLMFARAGRAPIVLALPADPPETGSATVHVPADAPPRAPEPAPQIVAMLRPLPAPAAPRVLPPPAALPRPSPPAVVAPSVAVPSVMSLLSRVPGAPATREPLRAAPLPPPPVFAPPPVSAAFEMPVPPTMLDGGEGGTRPAVIAILPEPRVVRGLDLETAGLGLRTLLLGLVAGIAAVYLDRTAPAS